MSFESTGFIHLILAPTAFSGSLIIHESKQVTFLVCLVWCDKPQTKTTVEERVCLVLHLTANSEGKPGQELEKELKPRP